MPLTSSSSSPSSSSSRRITRSDWCGCPFLVAVYRDVLIILGIWIIVATYISSFQYRDLLPIVYRSWMEPYNYISHWISFILGLGLTFYWGFTRLQSVFIVGLHTVLSFVIFITLSLLIDYSIWNPFYKMFFSNEQILYLKNILSIPQEPFLNIYLARCLIAMIGMFTVSYVRQLWYNVGVEYGKKYKPL